MPCRLRACPVSIPALPRFFRSALPTAAVVVSLAGPATSEQLWSVHAFGVKVGELRVKMQETGSTYQGAGKFETTGLVGIVASIRFDAASNGRIGPDGYVPSRYEGHINTGKRVSETELLFSGGTPKEVSGKQDPAVPIQPTDLAGALDPMTLMWMTLRDLPAPPACTQDEKQFDGTRLARLRLTERIEDGAEITCAGSYDRLGGYTSEELAEMSRSPTSVTYRLEDGTWRASKVRLSSRHGPATLVRRR
ncbi:DUF3108 domain-containing protein [Shimia sp. SDUM112013]|uniref:DUF3108 domain-containing protein n=1 Tax=Shimia sp. SDUM112013 TaxID=3136160 RepID=UPI0032EAA3B7